MAAVVSISTLVPPVPHAGRSPRSAGVRRPTPVRPSRRNRAAAVYRRRRCVAAAVGLGVIMAAGQAGVALGGSPLASAGRRPPAATPEVVTVVVEPGDTLWSIAHRLAPRAETREVVDALVEARGTASIVPGETLTWLAD
jgi:nucleoid-associated protein YgaU